MLLISQDRQLHSWGVTGWLFMGKSYFIPATIDWILPLLLATSPSLTATSAMLQSYLEGVLRASGGPGPQNSF